jgi:2-methylcitrate dehydratase PrpD
MRGEPDSQTAPKRPQRLLSEVIATYVAEFDLTKTPPEVVERARIGIIDTIGVMLAGSREEVSEIVCQTIEEEGGSPRSTIFGRSLRASPQWAALANGVAAHAMDYDFSYARGQAVSAVIPALLPLAEARDASPAEVLSAFIVACEVAARLVRASPKISVLGGWHATGIIGPIAAGVGCARLLGLAAARIPDVIGIAASLASGMSENYGTMTKPLHSGNAARNGVLAALLGARGFSSSAKALDGPSGYFATFSRGLTTDLAPFDDLGRAHNLVEPGYKLKLYPCGGLSHASIDAALALRGDLGGAAADIAKIEVGVTRHAFERIGNHYPHSIESAKFSMPFIGAWTVLHGAPSIATFTESAIEDARVKAFAPRISHYVDPEFADEIGEAPGRVTVTLKNGESFERKVWYASGSAQSPLSPAQIEAKFFDCAKQAVQEDRAERIFAWLSDLPKQPTFTEFWKLIRAA